VITEIQSVEIGITDEGYYYVSAMVWRDGYQVGVHDWIPDLVLGGPEVERNHWKGLE